MLGAVLGVALLMAGDKEAEDAISAFRTAIKSPDLAARVSAVEELGRCRHERVMRILGGCLATDDKAIRLAAARALAGFDSRKPQASQILAAALEPNSKEAEVVAAIFTALKNLGEPGSLQTAYLYIDHKDARAAEAAIGLTGAVRSRNSIDPLLRLMKKLRTSGDGYSSGDGNFDVPPDEQLRERARRLQGAASKALQSITGQSLSSVEDWEAWWKRNAGSFTLKS